ncbi:hypothetical protein BO86DRAFT_233226 [Aspergillus japonicus CBS 114.51]|uniref:C2H2-type domain-containing protein n=2 Tax=Aspergillus TaxID=5052 RepID=A0A2V5HCK0_ASPV1|nr:hypothetical protein BO86DRAFT_233226 [Aspergillus japonicus CBS 114.51]PYI22078.1 hypothetical protein BO99DRAFT_44315 [Aspergillus violaceofuscus CBS 115571]RAH77066.1 hypothetical protein BO86DRAFT_233226 [Aspergillus japonicus CBS 114.51]
MDLPRISLPSINIYDFNKDSVPQNPNFPATPLGTMSGNSYPSHGPMPIRNNLTPNFAPPPLPPPPRISDLEDGYDAGWLHANSRGTTKLAPINPSSSLFGGHRRPEPVSLSDRMALDDLDGRQSGFPLSRSPEAHIRIEPPPPMDEGFRNAISIKSPSPILKGERDFSRRSVKDSSDAYDQHLLSKIGKPLSPRQSISGGSEPRGTLQTLTIPTRNFGGIPSPGGSDSSALDVRWPGPGSYQSGGVSPGTKVGWRDYIGGRSPSVESSAPSSAVDLDHSGYLREVYRRRGGTTPSYDENISLPSRSHRGSYDHGVFSDIEGDFSTDESLPSRMVYLREATPPYSDASKSSGLKRRASSPPREPMGDDRHRLHIITSNGDLTQRRTSGQPYTNNLTVNSGYVAGHGSHSAASSLSIRTTGSYSSAGLSVGGSSMTSYDRSPGGLSPKSDLDTFHDKSIMNPTSPAHMVAPPVARVIQGPSIIEPSSVETARKMSLQTNHAAPKPTGPKLGGLYICDCCPKKPKKFDSPEELRSHEMEKQYSCLYCNNRFKNKNEAERHQNSLHLRRHSWSCAALSSYQAAFHPSSTPGQTGAGPSHDTCGYCGEEFPNHPQPDWDRRFEHLTVVHKFGECNNAKKFFRADHFRQHLKHSHAGTSGKWTNILENACMKEEAPPEPKNGGVSLANNKINEVLGGC